MNRLSYQYTDGNANRYVITTDSLEYVPVRLEESSSGFYTGGNPAKVKLSTEQFEQLSTLLKQVKDNAEIQINDRVKMSGQITIVSANSTRHYIIKPGSKEIADIEGALKEILNRK